MLGIKMWIFFLGIWVLFYQSKF